MVTHLLLYFFSQTHLLKINMTQTLFLAIYCVRIILEFCSFYMAEILLIQRKILFNQSINEPSVAYGGIFFSKGPMFIDNHFFLLTCLDVNSPAGGLLLCDMYDNSLLY